MLSLRRLAVHGAALVALSGCATVPTTPVDTVAMYASALREGRLADAYGLLSADARRTLAYPDFARAAREHPSELRDAVAAYSQVDLRSPVIARLDLGDGETVSLFLEGGRWRLDPAALEFYGQHTPRQTLRSFVRALERQRWDVLVSLAPQRIASRMTPETLRAVWMGREADSVRAALEALRTALDRGTPVEEAGDRATLTYGPGGRSVAQLLREDGRWTLERTE